MNTCPLFLGGKQKVAENPSLGWHCVRMNTYPTS